MDQISGFVAVTNIRIKPVNDFDIGRSDIRYLANLDFQPDSGKRPDIRLIINYN